MSVGFLHAMHEEETVPTFSRSLEQVSGPLLVNDRHQDCATLRHQLLAWWALHLTIGFVTSAPRCWRWSRRSCRKKSKTDHGVVGQEESILRSGERFVSAKIACKELLALTKSL